MTDAPERVREAMAGLALGAVRPQNTHQDRTGVRAVTEGDEIGQQITGFLGGKSYKLLFTLDSQSTESVEP
jgi:hypothetical protein